jgi:hypothetical protein
MSEPDPEAGTNSIPEGRRRLADRRTCEGFDFELGGQRYHATIGRFDDGTPAEIFLNGEKPNSTADVAARDCAVAISIGLQYGVPLDVVGPALMRDSRGVPVSPAAYVLDVLLAEQRGPG